MWINSPKQSLLLWEHALIFFTCVGCSLLKKLSWPTKASPPTGWKSQPWRHPIQVLSDPSWEEIQCSVWQHVGKGSLNSSCGQKCLVLRRMLIWRSRGVEGWGIRALELWADGPGRADRRTLPCDSSLWLCLWQANPTCELLTHFPHFYELNYVSSNFMS